MNAIIGATASGKSSLAFYLATKFKLDIFSIDSLSVYRYIDIASAKPSKAELSQVKHYGIDLLNPDERCNAKIFFDLLQKVAKPNILIVGGSSFYLKSIVEGLSFIPKTTAFVESYLLDALQNKAESYKFLNKIDPIYASKINPNDKYRIQKALEIFLLTNQTPSDFFAINKRQKLPFKINIFELIKPKDSLINDIVIRTDLMFKNGLIDEVRYLMDNYPNSQSLKAIGIKEIISFLNGEISQERARELIIKNTIALAKRQTTFNKTQFSQVQRATFDDLNTMLTDLYKRDENGNK
ncbi:tRNA (adenosine(37)-N6)-dimethylallyltransferase MiaA [Helicobacter sp. 16-1353]|uniref:tRNA (adenosine(37)-N6)-dimethylallyltransferase MiaA n=1 Tax=Helicobacter sp. 16-1353 TaxID=2004996 RepID=UPI000DCED720|nr:tRNA (adenosine(37)-N6)-dimethylallyltransferase MiaA [Helicobacter sp. 16-1353]RAX55288.1 tRNA (adenosine(37)-N6)-dimethylallyltransferase MiaA [Helicobacter sp. 16-1353]